MYLVLPNAYLGSKRIDTNIRLFKLNKGDGYPIAALRQGSDIIILDRDKVQELKDLLTKLQGDIHDNSNPT